MATATATAVPYNAAAAAAAAGKEETTRPIAVASPTVHPAATGDEEEAATATRRWRPTQYLRKRRCLLWCCGCCATSVVLLGITVLVLALTVFRVKDPVLTMNGVTLEGVDGGPGSTPEHPVSVNATLSADISIKNPNVASFAFGRSETDFYYGGETVGVAYAPRGEVGADRTVRMNVTLDVLADRVSPSVNATDLIFGKEYNLTSYTEIAGRISVLGIYKRDLDIKMNCSITLEVRAFTTVQSKATDCVANVS